MTALRPAQRPDLPRVVALDREVFGDPTYPDFFFRQALDLWAPLLWVAGSGDTLDGYTLGALGTGGSGWVLSLGVRRSARGRGLGRGLLDAVVGALRDAGARSVELTVHPDSAAVRLYEAAGFEVVGREEDYFGPGAPRLRLGCRAR